MAAAGECERWVSIIAPSESPAATAAPQVVLPVTARVAKPIGADISRPPIGLRGCEIGSAGAPCTSAALAANGGISSG